MTNHTHLSPLPDDAAAHRISVVVLTHRRPGELARTLHALCDYPDHPPVIVVDNDSRDGTAVMVATEFPCVRLIRARANLGGCARNLGAAQVRTPYVAFCDDDTWWTPDSLRRAVRLFDAHPRVAAMTARVLVGPMLREDATCQQMLYSPLQATEPLPGPPILGLLAGATAFRTDAFITAGGYHPRLFLGGEETLLALDIASAGWHLVYAPQLTVFHFPSALRDAARRRWLLARNAVWSAWLRLPAGAALAQTARGLPAIWRDGGARGVWDTLHGLPWALSQRRVIPPRVEAMRQCIAEWEASGARASTSTTKYGV